MRSHSSEQTLLMGVLLPATHYSAESIEAMWRVPSSTRQHVDTSEDIHWVFHSHLSYVESAVYITTNLSLEGVQ